MSDAAPLPARSLSPAAGIAVGLVAGLASGLLGIGGGLVVVPLLTASVGVATELVVAPSNLRWGPAAVLATAAIAGAWIGARAVAATRPRVLGVLMAVVLVIAAVRMSHLLEALLHRPEAAPFAGAG